MNNVLIISIYDSGYYWSIEENIKGTIFNYDREDYVQATLANEAILKLAKYVNNADISGIRDLIFNDLDNKYDLVYVCLDGSIYLVKDVRK